jgi:hypothetical protein
MFALSIACFSVNARNSRAFLLWQLDGRNAPLRNPPP